MIPCQSVKYQESHSRVLNNMCRVPDVMCFSVDVGCQKKFWVSREWIWMQHDVNCGLFGTRWILNLKQAFLSNIFTFGHKEWSSLPGFLGWSENERMGEQDQHKGCLSVTWDSFPSKIIKKRKDIRKEQLEIWFKKKRMRMSNWCCSATVVTAEHDFWRCVIMSLERCPIRLQRWSWVTRN